MEPTIRDHLVTCQRKTWGITDADLLTLAAAFDVRRAADLLARAADAVARWLEFAQRAGVPRAETDRIQAYHPGWVNPRRSGPR